MYDSKALNRSKLFEININNFNYHIEEGEELFYQIKGDMCVKILENGQHKDIHIKEGEIFILPGKGSKLQKIILLNATN
jgi:hypothetical protein